MSSAAVLAAFQDSCVNDASAAVSRFAIFGEQEELQGRELTSCLCVSLCGSVFCMAGPVPQLLDFRLSSSECAAVQRRDNDAHLTARMMPVHMMGPQGDRADIPEELLLSRLGAQVGCNSKL